MDQSRSGLRWVTEVARSVSSLEQSIWIQLHRLQRGSLGLVVAEGSHVWAAARARPGAMCVVLRKVFVGLNYLND